MAKIQELKEKVRELIRRNDEVYKGVKSAWTFLYKYIDELESIETLERLKDVEGGKYLFAYLAYKSIARANFQPEHLELTGYEDAGGLVSALETDILNYEKGLDKPPREPDPYELLQMLRHYIRKGMIKQNLSYWKKDGEDWVGTTPPTEIKCDWELRASEYGCSEEFTFGMSLGDIEVEDPNEEADKFLAKHGLKEDKHDLVKCPKCSNTKFNWDDKGKRYYCKQHPKEIIK